MSRKVIVKNEKDAWMKATRCLSFIYNHTSISYHKQTIKLQTLARLLKLIEPRSDTSSLMLESATLNSGKAKVLGAFQTRSPFIRALYVQNNQMGDIGLSYLVSGIIARGTISVLDISNNYLTPKAEPLLVKLLNRCPSLTALHIGGNQLMSQTSARRLPDFSKAVGRSTSLKVLGLYNIGYREVSRYLEFSEDEKSESVLNSGENDPLFKALKQNRSIVSLDLSYNCLKPGQFKAISEILATRNQLRCLRLSWNVITVVKTLEGLFTSVTNSSSLQEFDMSGCKLTDNVTYNITCMIKKNSSLVSLYLGTNNFDEESIKKIKDALKSNYKIKKLDLKVESKDSRLKEIDWGMGREEEQQHTSSTAIKSLLMHV